MWKFSFDFLQWEVPFYFTIFTIMYALKNNLQSKYIYSHFLSLSNDIQIESIVCSFSIQTLMLFTFVLRCRNLKTGEMSLNYLPSLQMFFFF